MKRFSRLALPLSLGIFALSGYIPPQDRRYVDYFLKLQSAELFRTRSFLLNSSWAYVSQKKLERVEMRFSYYKILDVNKTRKLITSVAQELVEKINSDSVLQEKALLPEPFTIDQLCLEIRMDNVMSANADQEAVKRVRLEKGVITYEFFKGSTIFHSSPASAYKETYQYALMLLDEPTEFQDQITPVQDIPEQKSALEQAQDVKKAQEEKKAIAPQRAIFSPDVTTLNDSPSTLPDEKDEDAEVIQEVNAYNEEKDPEDSTNEQKDYIKDIEGEINNIFPGLIAPPQQGETLPSTDQELPSQHSAPTVEKWGDTASNIGDTHEALQEHLWKIGDGVTGAHISMSDEDDSSSQKKEIFTDNSYDLAYAQCASNDGNQSKLLWDSSDDLQANGDIKKSSSQGIAYENALKYGQQDGHDSYTKSVIAHQGSAYDSLQSLSYQKTDWSEHSNSDASAIKAGAYAENLYSINNLEKNNEHRLPVRTHIIAYDKVEDEFPRDEKGVETSQKMQNRLRLFALKSGFQLLDDPTQSAQNQNEIIADASNDGMTVGEEEWRDEESIPTTQPSVQLTKEGIVGEEGWVQEEDVVVPPSEESINKNVALAEEAKTPGSQDWQAEEGVSENPTGTQSYTPRDQSLGEEEWEIEEKIPDTVPPAQSQSQGTPGEKGWEQEEDVKASLAFNENSLAVADAQPADGSISPGFEGWQNAEEINESAPLPQEGVDNQSSPGEEGWKDSEEINEKGAITSVTADGAEPVAHASSFTSWFKNLFGGKSAQDITVNDQLADSSDASSLQSDQPGISEDPSSIQDRSSSNVSQEQEALKSSKDIPNPQEIIEEFVSSDVDEEVRLPSENDPELDPHPLSDEYLKGDQSQEGTSGVRVPTATAQLTVPSVEGTAPVKTGFFSWLFGSSKKDVPQEQAQTPFAEKNKKEESQVEVSKEEAIEFGDNEEIEAETSNSTQPVLSEDSSLKAETQNTSFFSRLFAKSEEQEVPQQDKVVADAAQSAEEVNALEVEETVVEEEVVEEPTEPSFFASLFGVSKKAEVTPQDDQMIAEASQSTEEVKAPEVEETVVEEEVIEEPTKPSFFASLFSASKKAEVTPQDDQMIADATPSTEEAQATEVEETVVEEDVVEEPAKPSFFASLFSASKKAEVAPQDDQMIAEASQSTEEVKAPEVEETVVEEEVIEEPAKPSFFASLFSASKKAEVTSQEDQVIAGASQPTEESQEAPEVEETVVEEDVVEEPAKPSFFASLFGVSKNAEIAPQDDQVIADASEPVDESSTIETEETIVEETVVEEPSTVDVEETVIEETVVDDSAKPSFFASLFGASKREEVVPQDDQMIAEASQSTEEVKAPEVEETVVEEEVVEEPVKPSFFASLFGVSKKAEAAPQDDQVIAEASQATEEAPEVCLLYTFSEPTRPY